MAEVKAIPEGYRTVTPFLNVDGANEAIAFYKKAFGAEEKFRMPTPDGKVMHAELKIGDSMLMVSDAMMNPRDQLVDSPLRRRRRRRSGRAPPRRRQGGHADRRHVLGRRYGVLRQVGPAVRSPRPPGDENMPSHTSAAYACCVLDGARCRGASSVTRETDPPMSALRVPSQVMSRSWKRPRPSEATRRRR